jgi:biotin-dependent carboxylase-like uncharacterized protein
MGLVVIRPGLFSTVQDAGRSGYREVGVVPGGWFDKSSAGIANALLGNDPGAAVLEMTLVGGVFEARCPLAVGLAGAPIEVAIKTREGQTVLDLPIAFSLAEGDQVTLGRVRQGARTYLTVLGGFQTPLVLGSRSSETPLRSGDLLPCRASWSPVRRLDPAESLFEAVGPDPLRVIDGPDASQEAIEGLTGSAFRISSMSDRMGLRLEGPQLKVVDDPNRVSAPVAPGAVQVAGGHPLVLGVACGTMGGYAHLAQIVSADIDRLGQARPGDTVTFRRVTLTEARELDHHRTAHLSALLVNIGAASRDRGVGADPTGHD